MYDYNDNVNNEFIKFHQKWIDSIFIDFHQPSIENITKSTIDLYSQIGLKKPKIIVCDNPISSQYTAKNIRESQDIGWYVDEGIINRKFKKPEFKKISSGWSPVF